MRALFRFTDWPLRAKMAALLVVATLLPLAVAAFIDIRDARERLLSNTAALLEARGDQLRDELDTLNRGHQNSVDKLARLPATVEFFRAGPNDAGRLKSALRRVLDVYPASDANVRGAGILDLSGTVRLATEDSVIGANLSYLGYVREALRGAPVISDIHLAGSEAGRTPTIAYLAPVFGPNRKLVGTAVLWIRAASLWNLAKASNGLAGPGSFAVLFDQQGIRIAHTYNDDIVFHPGGRLDSATVDALVAERRFGERTRELLEDVRAFPEQFDRALAKSPDEGLFHGFAPVNQTWNYGVGRRFATAPWTVFYMIPEASLVAQIAQATRKKAVFAGAITLIALMAGTLFAVVILRPVRSLSAATGSIAAGDLAARVQVDGADELGRLGASFNSMAGRIQAQATALQSAHDKLELRVQERTADLVQTTRNLELEIVERKRAESAMRESQRLLQAVFENSTAIIWVKDLDGRYLLVNGRHEDVFRYRREEIVGKTDYDLLPKEQAEIFRTVDRQALAAGTAVQAEEAVLHDDGSYSYLLSIKSPLRDDAGKPYALCGISTDITERKLAEQKLQAQLGRLDLLHRITRATGERQDLQSIFQVVVRSLEDNMPLDFCCICLYDPVAQMLTVTSVGVRSGAMALELALAERARIDIDQNGLSRCVRGQLVYEPDIGGSEFPFPQRLARGGLRSLVAAPLLVESKVFGVVVAARRQPQSFRSGECEFLRQLSEHVALAAHQAQLYGALQQAYDDLRQTQQAVMQQERLRALGQMASGIAHDINNAISPVALYTEVLLEKEQNLSARARDYLETIQRAIGDVAQTVARMREFYRQREPQLTLAPVNLNRMAQQVLDLTRARWSDMPQQRGVVIRVQTELAPDLPDIMGVESEIREALINLVFNAIDAMPDGGTLTLRSGVENGVPAAEAFSAPRHIYVEIADAGVGMDEDTRRRCLEPFFTTKGDRGTGLGLAMVFGVVQRHSAEIEIESAPGQGTTIRLVFLAATVTEPVQADAAYAVPSRLRVLVVDDDPLLLKSLHDTLETEGHIVVTANGGQAGVDTFRKAQEHGEPFAVVITDLGMPHVDGRKVANDIKAASPSTPVILLTGWGQRLVAEGDVPPHVDRVLNKPPRLNELREAFAQCCRPAASEEASGSRTP